MTQVTTPGAAATHVDPVGDTVAIAVAAADAPPPDAARPLSTPRTLVAAGLGSGAAAWMTGGIFRDAMAGRALGLLGIAVAAALLLAGARSARATVLQFLVLPAAVVVGTLLVLPSTSAGTTVPSLVADAVRAGGILQPPIPLDPGWRLVLVVLFAGLCACATALALTTDRPMLAVAVPLPVVAVPALVQPDSAELVSVGGSIVLLAAGLAAAYGADLSRQAALGFEFERSRLARGGALVAALVLVVAGLGRVGVLFPQPQRSHVTPPQPPPPPVAQTDRPLFTVHFAAGPVVPLRLGVLDVYDQNRSEWLLPSYDTARLATVHAPAGLPQPQGGRGITVQVTVNELGGHDLPEIAGADHVAGLDDTLLFDPDTGQLRLADRPAPQGLSYTLEAPALPASAAVLAAAPAPPGSVADHLGVAAAPAEVTKLLAAAPRDGFDRMQFLRQQLYAKVVAAGTGSPVPVSAERVGAMLRGGSATPFEITAAEALLARWAGVPSRIGFGYEATGRPGGTVTVRPADGSAWLEAYFTGYGWLPITGVPPHAQATLDTRQHTVNPLIRPSDRLALTVYVPVRVHTELLLYEQVRYVVVRVLPALLAVALAVAGYPLLLKRLRRRRRARWAAGQGRRARIAVAYCELRDACRDLAIGDPVATPLQFLAAVAPDDEHAELAWLVTRALWGDLARDLREDDVENAEMLSRSIRRRLHGAQSFLDRGLAAVARTSLRHPYSDEVPNLWWAGARLPRPSLPRRRGARLRPLGATAAALLLVVAGVGAGRQWGARPPVPLAAAAATSTTASPDAQLDRLVPAAVGALRLQREPSAEVAYRRAGADSEVVTGHVYTLHNGDVVEGSVQVSLLKPDVDQDAQPLRDGLVNDLGAGSLDLLQERVPLDDGSCLCPGAVALVRVDDDPAHSGQRIYVAALPDQRVYLWFPAGTHAMEILVLRSQVGVTAADALALTLSDHQHGAPLAPVPLPVETPAEPSPSPAGSAAPGIGGTP